MMRASRPPETQARLLPEGRRWGFGAHSVVPYLAMTLHARPGAGDDAAASIRNPVFPAMEDTLRALRQGH
ncbi:MAG TPA: hypothetical protein VGD76_09990 [Ramlibacter sp.]